ncbi:receptor-like protein 15 [Cicer arietinum]
MSWNNFEGNIPSSIGKMKNLESLDVSHNHFLGELPKGLATYCEMLTYLKVSNNYLQGNIPKFSNWMNMEVLFLNNNNFSGTLEDVLGNNIGLIVLYISNNSISGTIPNSIVMFSSMRVLLMANNLLEGEIPKKMFLNMSMLQIMDLSQNKLIGSLPKFNSLTSLRFLYLQKNYLSGSIPFELSKSSNLQLLDLRENKFYGNIPNSIDKFSELKILLLGGNNFEGEIPIQLCQLKKVDILDLSRNVFNASIPSCFQNLSFGMGQYDDDGYDYGPVFEISMYNPPIYFLPNEESLFDARLLILLPLFDLLNEDLKLEVEFRTKNNDYFYKGKVLENMTGLDLSCNKLTGQFGDFDDENYRGNPDLCGPLLKRKCEDVAFSPSSPSNENEENETKVDMIAFYWSFAASYITILLAILTVLYINVDWRMVLFYYVDKVILRCFPTFPLH